MYVHLYHLRFNYLSAKILSSCKKLIKQMFKKLTASFKTKASSKDSEKMKEEEKLPEVTMLDSDLMARPLKSQPAVAKPADFKKIKKTAPVTMKRKGLPMK